MNRFEIKACGAADLAMVTALAKRIWPVVYAEIISREQIAYMLNMMYVPEVLARELRDGIRFDLLYVNGEPVGFAAYGPPSHGKLKLHKLYLLPEFHGRGCGSQLLQHVIVQARQINCSTVVLNVNKHNQQAIRAYHRNGFQVAASVVNAIGNGFVMDDFVMELELS